MRAMLTRDDDYFVPLNARVQRRAGCRRTCSFPFTPTPSTPTARGSSVFALSEHGATRRGGAMACTARKSGRLDRRRQPGQQGTVLARTLLDLSQTAQINDSLRVGRSVLDGIGAVNPLHKGSVEQAGFAVLKAPDIPSILVETAFISNPDEELKLKSDKHQHKFAESIFSGVKRYFAQNPPLSRSKLS